MPKSIQPFVLSLATALAASSGPVLAESYEVTIVNATRGQVIPPPFVATHSDRVGLFWLGQTAPDYLVPLAEDGDSSLVLDAAAAFPNVYSAIGAEGPIMPGHSLTLNIESSPEFPLITVAAMLATSNDAFLAVNGATLPSGNAPATLTADVYDAGSEANTEACTSIPGPPCGNGGVRDTDGAEGFVHVHSGIHGTGDLVPEKHDWRNPGAYVMVRKLD